MQLPRLKAGDCVEIIAPASRCSDTALDDLRQLLESWELECLINETLFGKDLLCANTDAIRFELLKNALHHPKTKAIICARGGYGSSRLIPELNTLSPNPNPKLFVGMSDVTALHLFLGQQWQWPTIHGALSRAHFSPESISALKSMLFGHIASVALRGTPLNVLAQSNVCIEAQIIGGNLSLIQAGMGTSWQVGSHNKIILLEEIGERAYRIDRMLTHLQQAGVFNTAKALILGDFLNGNEPNGSSLIKPVLMRFAQQCPIPVIQIEGIGHGSDNMSIPFGIKATLQLGDVVQCSIPLAYD